MHYGSVNENLEPCVTLAVRGESGESEAITFAIDTGFTESVTLPRRVIDRLNLRREDYDSIIVLADGTPRVFAVYSCWIDWHGRARAVDVIAAEADPLLGMSVISGSNLSVDATPGGAVTISELPGPAG